MAGLKENLAYLSEITGMQCKEGDFDQITRVASNLYVDGHNYMMGKDWTQLDEQKLDQLCTDMREALSETSTKNVARIKWNDPWAPVFPIYPDRATEERKKETEAFWKRYEEKRFKNGVRMFTRAEGQARKTTDPSAEQFFAEDQDFWMNGNHVYLNFNGDDTRERGGFVRLLLYAQGLTEEEVLDPESRTEEKKETVDRLKRVIDANSGLSAEEREEEMGKLLKTAENAFDKRKFRPLDLNDINSFEDYAYNRMVAGEYADLFQIVDKNKDTSKVCGDTYAVLFRKAESVTIMEYILQFESDRACKADDSYNPADDQRKLEDIPLEEIPKAKLEELDGMKQQAKIDVMGLAWNDTYKEMFKYVSNPEAKVEKADLYLGVLQEDDRVQMMQLGEKYNETTSKIEKQMIHNEQLQIIGKYSLEAKEQEKLKEVNEIPKKDAVGMLFEKLKDADPAYLKSSEEFKKLKASLEEAVKADPDDITQKMQAVYENANEYILRKAAKPATGHGKERLAAAREIRNTISEMLEQKDSYYQMAEMFDFIRAPRQAADGTKAKLHQENITRFTRKEVLGVENPDNTLLNDDERCAVATAFMSAEEYYDKAKKDSTTEKTKIKENALKKAKRAAKFIAPQLQEKKMESAGDLYSAYMIAKKDNDEELTVMKQYAQDMTIRSILLQKAAKATAKDIVNNKETVFGGKEKRMQVLQDCREIAKKNTAQAKKAYNSRQEKALEPEKKQTGRSL